MWDQLHRIAILMETLLISGGFETQDDTSFEYAGKMKGDSRALLDDLVPHCVRRFIWNTAPRKFSVSKFWEWGNEKAAKFSDYTEVCVMRKYDGWFVVLYVGADKRVYWQTMSGFLNSRIHGLMREFIEWVEKLAACDKLKPNTAFKIEFVMQDEHHVDHLQLVGKRVDAAKYHHKIVITDYFVPYTPRLDEALMSAVTKQRSAARVHSQAPLNPDDWRNMWNNRSGRIGGRMEKVGQLMVDNPMSSTLHASVECAAVVTYSKVSPLKLIATLASQLCRSRPHHQEGFVMHCYCHADGKYNLLKFKLEYMGALSMYYSPTADRVSSVPKHAGRQFVVRLLTVECLHGSYVPYRLGVGYWDAAKGRWVVTDSLPLKHDGKLIGGFLSVNGDRLSTKANANAIAKILSIAKPGLDNKDLVYTEHFKKESSPNIINVCDTGLIIAGSANAVYKSEQNNYHLQAAVIKHVGLSQTRFKRELDVAQVSVEFAATSAAFSSDCVTPAMFPTDRFILPEQVSTEWEKEQWMAMEDHVGFNASCCLSKCAGGGVDLFSRLREVNVPPFMSRVDDDPIEFPTTGQYNTFMFVNPLTKFDFHVIQQGVKGYCLQSVAEVNETNISSTLDILVVKGTLTRADYVQLKAVIKEDFVILNNNWYKECQKTGFTRIESKYVYDMGMWCENCDKLDYVNRLISRRASQRKSMGFNESPQVYHAVEQLPDLPPARHSTAPNRRPVVIVSPPSLPRQPPTVVMQPPSPSPPDSPILPPPSPVAPASPPLVAPPSPELLSWNRRDRPSFDPRASKRPTTAPQRLLPDRTKPLLDQRFFIYQYDFLEDSNFEDIDSAGVIAISLAQSLMDRYPRCVHIITEQIRSLGGIVDDSHQAGYVVVVHLPRWNLSTFQTLLHPKYFSDLETYVQSCSNKPDINEYIFVRTGAGLYKNIHGNSAESKWFQL